MKKVLILCCFFLIHKCITAQQNDSLLVQDSIGTGLLNDSLMSAVDTTHVTDSIAAAKSTAINEKRYGFNEILKEHLFLDVGKPAVSHIQSNRNYISKDLVFYLLALILLFLGIIKVAWPRYFSNLVRVFFNTSLRQGQLTDQLLQAKLPSMLFNLFFILVGGWYIYLLLLYFDKVSFNNWNVLLSCIGGLFLVYVIKFCTLKFAGWLTGYRDEAETYIFIVFLINKIVAVCLVPIVVIITFSMPHLVHIAVIISYILIVMMLIMRFFRSYGLLQPRLKVSGFHFLLYIVGIEILPLLLIYKFALIILSKNL